MTQLFVRLLAAACITQSVSARKNVLFFAVDGKLLAPCLFNGIIFVVFTQ